MTFITRVRARYCETDAAEVIYYGSFMHYFEVGKMEMFRELGLIYQKDIPIVETFCRYKAPGHFDELLEIRSMFDDVKEMSFKVRAEVYRVEDDGSFTLLGSGYTTHVYVKPDGKVGKLPRLYFDTFKKLGIEITQ